MGILEGRYVNDFPWSPSLGVYYVSEDGELTCWCRSDSRGPQSSGTYRSAYYGRLGPRGPDSLLLAFRHFPPLLGQGPFRIYLRPRTSRLLLLAHHPLTHVSSLRTHNSFSLAPILTPLFEPDIPAVRVCAGVLSVAAGADEYDWGVVADGWDAGVCVDEYGGRVVHV